MAKTTYVKKSITIDYEVPEDATNISTIPAFFNLGTDDEFTTAMKNEEGALMKDPGDDVAVFFMRRLEEGKIPAAHILAYAVIGFASPMRMAQIMRARPSLSDFLREMMN